MAKTDTIWGQTEKILRKKLPRNERAIILGIFLMVSGGGWADLASYLHAGWFTYANGIVLWFLGFMLAFIGGIQWLSEPKEPSLNESRSQLRK